jgi:hypothetical protein
MHRPQTHTSVCHDSLRKAVMVLRALDEVDANQHSKVNKRRRVIVKVSKCPPESRAVTKPLLKHAKLWNQSSNQSSVSKCPPERHYQCLLTGAVTRCALAMMREPNRSQNEAVEAVDAVIKAGSLICPLFALAQPPSRAPILILNTFSWWHFRGPENVSGGPRQRSQRQAGWLRCFCTPVKQVNWVPVERGSPDTTSPWLRLRKIPKKNVAFYHWYRTQDSWGSD